MVLCQLLRLRPQKTLCKRRVEILRIAQIRYYGDGDTRNAPADLTAKQLTQNDNGLLKNYGDINQIGIQARPNAEFWLNNSRYSIIMGETGIYELDLRNTGFITDIKFSSSTISVYNKPDNTDRLIIDIVYEG